MCAMGFGGLRWNPANTHAFLSTYGLHCLGECACGAGEEGGQFIYGWLRTKCGNRIPAEWQCDHCKKIADYLRHIKNVHAACSSRREAASGKWQDAPQHTTQLAAAFAGTYTSIATAQRTSAAAAGRCSVTKVFFTLLLLLLVLLVLLVLVVGSLFVARNERMFADLNLN